MDPYLTIGCLNGYLWRCAAQRLVGQRRRRRPRRQRSPLRAERPHAAGSCGATPREYPCEAPQAPIGTGWSPSSTHLGPCVVAVDTRRPALPQNSAAPPLSGVQ